MYLWSGDLLKLEFNHCPALQHYSTLLWPPLRTSEDFPSTQQPSTSTSNSDTSSSMATFLQGHLRPHPQGPSTSTFAATSRTLLSSTLFLPLQLLQDFCPLGRPLPTLGHPRPHLLFAFWDTSSASALWTPCPPQHHQLQSFSLGNKSGRCCNSRRLARRRRLSPPAAASALWTPCPPQHHQLQSFSLGNKSGRCCNSRRLARRRRLSPPAAASALWTPCPPQHHQLQSFSPGFRASAAAVTAAALLITVA